MEAGSHLKALLQFHLVSDASAVTGLPFILSSLSVDCFTPSSHLSKWTARINSLIHSKDPAARWAGLCIASRSAALSQNFMMESAQTWIGIAMPILSRNEPFPVLRAAVRLLRIIFTSVTDMNDFHRQIVLPNISKISAAISTLPETHTDVELKAVCIDTLTSLISIYPTAFKALNSRLSSLILAFQTDFESWPTARIGSLASRLNAVLPLTGGKVGSVNLWRKSLDSALALGWESFLSLRTTFPFRNSRKRPSVAGDPQERISLSLHRLQLCITTLCDLLRAPAQRPVQVPIGKMVEFLVGLLSCSSEEAMEDFADPHIYFMEAILSEQISCLGCDFLSCLAERLTTLLKPHSLRIATVLMYRLEGTLTIQQRRPYMMALKSLITACKPLDSDLLTDRLLNGIALPAISKISRVSHTATIIQKGSSPTKGRRSASRPFDAAENLHSVPVVVFPTCDHRSDILTCLDVLEVLISTPSLSPSIHSATAKVMVGVLITLSTLSPSSLSPDPAFYHELIERICEVALVVGLGTTSVMNKVFPWTLEATLLNNQQRAQRMAETLLHPRIPPLMRTVPPLHSLNSYGSDEAGGVHASGLIHPQAIVGAPLALESVQEDAVMEDSAVLYGELPLTSPPSQNVITSTVSRSSSTTIPVPAADGPLPRSKEVALPIPTSIKASQQETSRVVFGVGEGGMDDDGEMPGIDLGSDSEPEPEG